MSAPYSNLLTALLTLVVMAPFLRAVLVNKTNHPELFSTLWFKKRSNHIPLTLLLFLKILIAAAFLYFVLPNYLVCSHCWLRWQQQALLISSPHPTG